MRAREFITEGGWANPVTQNTIITPQLVDNVYHQLEVFVRELNAYLNDNNIPPVELGEPCGSTTYYKRDLVQNPTREYGDIDVHLHIPKIEGLSNNANAELIKNHIKQYCDLSTDYQTSNGTNVIVNINNDYVQVDLVMGYYHNKEWTSALAPEYNAKGVLCNSIYSSLGEALNLSIGGGHGVQAKVQGDELVPFRTVKNVDLVTITTNPKTWAVDIAKFFQCNRISPLLKQYPGMLGEIRVSDMIQSIKGIAQSMEMSDRLPDYNSAQDLLTNVKNIYLAKIGKVINSSKFDKASTQSAKEKAQHTKEVLASKSAEIAKLFTR